MRLSIGGADAARWSANGIAFPVGAVTSDAQLTLGGSLAAGDPGADVTIYAKNVRTAGYLLAIQNLQGSNRLLVDYNGLLRLQIPAAAIQPASLVTAPTVNANWTASKGLGYWKDASGQVHIRGYVSQVAGAVNPAFTLPAGFRPSQLREWSTPNDTHTAGVYVQVDTGGGVAVAVPGGTADGYLDCVIFLAEA